MTTAFLAKTTTALLASCASRVPLYMVSTRPLCLSTARPSSAPAIPSQAMSSAATSAFISGPPTYQPRYIDIGINLADPIFRGRYHGKERHPDDLAGVVQRAHDVGCSKLIVTGSSFKSSRDALKLAEQFPHAVYTTAGIHPCSSAIFERRHQHHHEADDEVHTPACGPDPEQPHADEHGAVDHDKSASILKDLQALIEAAPAGALVAFGEFGLDYDRLYYCSASTQRHAFAAQLALAGRLARPLPLFLHSRAAHADFVRLLQEQYGPHLEKLERGGVVHSFTGTVAEAEELMDLGLYLGVNGCSLKTVENCKVVKAIRLDRLMIETDGPWCEVRPSHEGWRYLVEAAEAEKAAKTQAEAKAGAEQARLAELAKAAEQVNTTQATETEAASGEAPRPQPPRTKKQKNQNQNQKSQKKEPAVPERFKTVKKEKWEEGAMVKGRNEPCMIERVSAIIAAIKGIPVEDVCEAAWTNTVKVFGLEE